MSKVFRQVLVLGLLIGMGTVSSAEEVSNDSTYAKSVCDNRGAIRFTFVKTAAGMPSTLYLMRQTDKENVLVCLNSITEGQSPSDITGIRFDVTPDFVELQTGNCFKADTGNVRLRSEFMDEQFPNREVVLKGCFLLLDQKLFSTTYQKEFSNSVKSTESPTK